jgi:hypothetical protein
MTSKQIGWLDKSDLLSMKKVSSKDVRYILVSGNFETLQALQTKFDTDDKIISFQLNR